MYCPACGSEATQGLNYCKRCGAILNAPAHRDRHAVRPISLTGMVWAVALFGVFGFAALIGGVISLAALGQRGDEIAVISVFGTLAVFGIIALFIRFLSRLAGISRPIEPPALPEGRTGPIEYRRPEITAQPEYLPSVTEHTTQMFDPTRRGEPDRPE